MQVETRINQAIEVGLRYWIILISICAAFILAGAVAIPLLAAHGFEMLANIGYRMYSLICPQQSAHSWFIEGQKMGFEQRDTAMFAAAVLSGPLFLCIRAFGFKGLNLRLVLLLQIPILFDVLSQMVGLRESGGIWRSWTGIVSVLAITGWLYPLIDADVQRSRRRIRNVHEPAERWDTVTEAQEMIIAKRNARL